MAFDPDIFLKERKTGFDPDAYISEVERPSEKIGFVENIQRAGAWGAAEKIPFSPFGLAKQSDLLLTINRLKEFTDVDYKEYKPKMESRASGRPVGFGGRSIAPAPTRESDNKRVEDYFDKLQEEAERDKTFMAKVGSGVSVLPAWMIEFIATGGAAAFGKQVTKKFTEKIVKKQTSVKLAGWVGGAVARTTVMPHRVGEAIVKRRIGPEGAEVEEGWATSMAKGWGTVFIEVASEETGAAITGGLSKIGKKLPFGGKLLKGLEKAWKKIHPTESSMEFLKQISTKAGYSNFIGEIGEERVATIMHSIANTEDFGTGKDSTVMTRLYAGLKQDIENLPVEVVVLAIPAVTRFAAAKGLDVMKELTEAEQIEQNKLYTEFEQIVQDISEGRFDAAETEGLTAEKNILRKVYFKGFVAKLTSIRNNADNIIAGAGNKEAQVKVMKSDLAKVQKHYNNISKDIKDNPGLLAELGEIEKLLPEYADTINSFAKFPSEEGFGRIKTVGGQIAGLSNKYGDRVAEQITLTEALPAAQQDAADTLRQFKADAVTRSEELQQMEYEELLTLAQDGDELAAWRIGEIDAERALEAGLPKFEVLFGEMLEGNEAAKNAIYNGEYQGGRSRQEALEATNRVDPIVEATDKMIFNAATVRVHHLAKLLGVDKKDRGRIQQDIVGKKSMKNMSMVEAKRVEEYFIAEAKKRGLATSTGKDLAGFIKINTTAKDVKDATKMDKTGLPVWKQMLQTPHNITSRFVSTMKHIERMLEALDGFTEGPVYNSIWTTVQSGLAGSRTDYAERVAKFKETLQGIYTPELKTEEGLAKAAEFIAAEETKAGKKVIKRGKRAIRKLVGDSLWVRYVTGSKMIVLEATETNPELALTASQQIGVYMALQNEQSRNHLFGKFTEMGFDNSAVVALEVVQKMTTEEKQIGDYMLADLESQFPRANQAAIIALGRPLEQRDNYFPIQLEMKGEKRTDNFLNALESRGEKKLRPGEPGFTKETKPEAKGALNLDSFSVYFRHLKQVEQFIHMAPVAKHVGDIVNNEEFQQAVNNKTSGHGTKVLKKWLKNSIRGHAFDFDTNLAEDAFLWLRRKGVMFTIARNIPSTLRQALSLTNVVAMHPVFAAHMSVHMAKSIDPRYFKMLEDRMKRLSPEMRHRNFERFLARIKHDAQVAGVITGKESWDEKAFSWQKWFDNRTVVNIWNAVYDSAQISEAVQKQFEVDGSEERAIHLANKVAGRTQPMGDVEHLPDFFRGGTIPTLLSTFQRQVSNNWNFWTHDIIGMRKAGKISKKMVAWRILFSYVIPSQIFGLISRGGLPDDWKDAAFDTSVYGLGPIFLAGRIVINAALGFAGGQTSVEDIIPATGSKAIAKLMRGDIKGAAYQAAKVAGAITGRFPLQYFRTGEGIRDIYTGETDDLRRLIYSDWSLTHYGWPGGKDEEERTFIQG